MIDPAVQLDTKTIILITIIATIATNAFLLLAASFFVWAA